MIKAIASFDSVPAAEGVWMSSHRRVETCECQWGGGFASPQNHLQGVRLRRGGWLLEMSAGIVMSRIRDRGHLSSLELFLRFELSRKLKGL